MTTPYIVLLATADATIPFAFLPTNDNVDAPKALQQAISQWRLTSQGAEAEEAYLKWWNTPPMYRPIEDIGWEAALVLMDEDTLKANNLVRLDVMHSTVEPGESVSLSLVADPPRPIQVSADRSLSVR